MEHVFVIYSWNEDYFQGSFTIVEEVDECGQFYWLRWRKEDEFVVENIVTIFICVL